VSFVVTTCISASSLGIVVVCTWLIFEKWSSPSQNAQFPYTKTPPGLLWIQKTWQSIWSTVRNSCATIVSPLSGPPRPHTSDHESHPQADSLITTSGEQHKQGALISVGYPSTEFSTPIHFTCVQQLEHLLKHSDVEPLPYETTLSAPHFDTDAYWVHHMAFSPDGTHLIAQCSDYHKLWSFDQVGDL
jgi:hypothetical protein